MADRAATCALDSALAVKAWIAVVLISVSCDAVSPATWVEVSAASCVVVRRAMVGSVKPPSCPAVRAAAWLVVRPWISDDERLFSDVVESDAISVGVSDAIWVEVSSPKAVLLREATCVVDRVEAKSA